MQIRWAAHHVLPEFPYRTNKVLKAMKDAAAQGNAKVTAQALSGC